jgi:hypothetical protein
MPVALAPDMSLHGWLRLIPAAAFCTSAFAFPSSVLAAEPDQAPSASARGAAWAERPLALHGVFALPAGPTGLAGFELDYSPISRIGLSAGIGAGYLITGGGWTPRYAFGARYRIPFGKAFALGFGGTFSTGRYAVKDAHFDDQDGQDDIMELDHAIWAGAQLSFEWRFNAVSFKVLSGVELLANASSASCYRTSYLGQGPREPLSCSNIHPLESKSVFMSPVGVAIGYSF